MYRNGQKYFYSCDFSFTHAVRAFPLHPILFNELFNYYEDIFFFLGLLLKLCGRHEFIIVLVFKRLSRPELDGGGKSCEKQTLVHKTTHEKRSTKLIIYIYIWTRLLLLIINELYIIIIYFHTIVHSVGLY